MEHSPENVPLAGAMIFRVDAALLYFNIEHVREAVRQSLRDAFGPLTLVVWDLSTSPSVDLAGARTLMKLHQELKEAGIGLRLVGANATVRDILRAEGLEEDIGYFGRRISLADVIDEFERHTTAAKSNWRTAPA
jgi:sulfate permease, SulP family